MDMGWKAMEKNYRTALKSAPVEETAVRELPSLNEQMTFLPVKTSIQEGKTSPPKSYTEATLLSSMENAGAEETPDDVERKGLGTPATRAGIIEKLVKTGQIERKKGKKGYFLLPTQKGVSLITVLPEELQSSLLTAEWEQKLKQIERGELEPTLFLQEITEMVRVWCRAAIPSRRAASYSQKKRKALAYARDAAARLWNVPKAFCAATAPAALRYGSKIPSLPQRKRN